MRFLKILLIYILIVAIVSALLLKNKMYKPAVVANNINKKDSVIKIDSAYTTNPLFINTGIVTPADIVNYAQQFIGTPYKYASTDPAVGFDCSGFITFVFNHFNITVPRSSVDFTNVPHEVDVTKAKPADLILFTGTDSTEHIVGHMGIIISNDSSQVQFIHASSGKADGVTITPLNDYYKNRFVKVIRIFSQNDKNSPS